MDIAAARFQVLKDASRNIAVHYLGEEDVGARRVLAAAQDATAVLERWFGAVPSSGGFAIIEIPEGWGSQAGTGYLLQAGAAFQDSTRLPEVFHEIAHNWNARPRPALQATRWFDEAFASYFQALVAGEKGGQAAREAQMERYREAFRRAVRADTRAAAVPIVAYGERGLGGLSYSKGAWSLYVLHLALGDRPFRRAVGAFLTAFREGGADFEGFVRAVETEGDAVDLSRWVSDWLSGTASSELLLGAMPADTIARRYVRRGDPEAAGPS